MSPLAKLKNMQALNFATNDIDETLYGAPILLIGTISGQVAYEFFIEISAAYV